MGGHTFDMLQLHVLQNAIQHFLRNSKKYAIGAICKFDETSATTSIFVRKSYDPPK
jgi:hypothetical protein